MTDLFTNSDDPLDVFDAFWDLWPRDKDRGQRKAGKDKCKAMWKHHKLAIKKGHVLAALKEDIAGIKKGKYGPEFDLMRCFKGIKEWLNQQDWDRDIEPKKEEPIKKEPPKQPEHVAMTLEEYQAKKAYFRKLARMKP